MENRSRENALPEPGSQEGQGLRGKRLLGLGRFSPEDTLGATVKVSVTSLHATPGCEHEELSVLASLHIASTRETAEAALLHSLGMYVTYLILCNPFNTLSSPTSSTSTPIDTYTCLRYEQEQNQYLDQSSASLTRVSMVISNAGEDVDASVVVDRSVVSSNADDSNVDVDDDVVSQLLSRGARVGSTEGTIHDNVRASMESIRSTELADLSILERGGNVTTDTTDKNTLPAPVTAPPGQPLPIQSSTITSSSIRSETIDSATLPRPHLTTPTATRQLKSSHPNEPILNRDSIHILDLSAEGRATISGLEGGAESGGTGMGLGCFVQYTLPGVTLDGSSTSPSKEGGVYSLWWDAECPVLNGRNHHVFLLDGIGTATTKDNDSKGVWDQGIEFTIYNSDSDGSLPSNPIALATATLSVAQLRSLVSHAGGSEIVDLPLSPLHEGSLSSGASTKASSTPFVLRLSLAHRIEPALLKTLTTSITSTIPTVAVKDDNSTTATATATTTAVIATALSSSSSNNAALATADTAGKIISSGALNQPNKSPSENISLSANQAAALDVHKSGEKVLERPPLAQQLFPDEPRHATPSSQLRPVTALRIAVTVDRLTIQTDILGLGGPSDAAAASTSVSEVNPVLHGGGSVRGTPGSGGGLGAVYMGGESPKGALSGAAMLAGESTTLHTSDGRAMELFCMVEAAVTDGDSSAGRRIPSGPLGDSFFTTIPCNVPPPDAEAINSHVTWAETGTLVRTLDYSHTLLGCLIPPLPLTLPPSSDFLRSFVLATYIPSSATFVHPRLLLLLAGYPHSSRHP